MIRFSKRVFFWVIRNVLPLFVISKNKVIFVSEDKSGCNSYALFRYLEKKSLCYDIELFENATYTNNDKIVQYVKKILKLSSAKVIVTTHGSVCLRGIIEINTWHSPLFKSIGVMENPSYKMKKQTSWSSVNIILSYSKLYSSLMNACILSNPYKYRITGAPRNDYLFNSDGRVNLNRIIGNKLNNRKVILFLPTFRLGYSKEQGSKNLNNIFGFDSFNGVQFNDFLRKNNILFVYKLHPNEESYYKKYVDTMDSDVSFRLSNDLLSNHKFDLYEIINSADILITDYSGIYIDYLLLDRPIIFTPVDLDDYASSRDFLYGPYNEWTPGPKVVRQNNLEDEVLKLLGDSTYYKSHRSSIKKMMHQYFDNKSCGRVSDVINSLLDDGRGR